MLSQVVAAVAADPAPKVFILWGSYARKKKKLITGRQHVVLESGHPSPLSETYFFGTRPFSRTNEALEKAGLAPVEWQLPATVTEAP